MCFCGCGYDIPHDDTDAANQDLVNQIASISDQNLYVNPGACWYLIRGSAVAFVCNPYGFPNYDAFRPGNVGSSDSQITSDCGWYVAETYAGAAMGSEQRGC